MSIVFFDTETTDKWDFKAPFDDLKQPRLVQLGALVFTDEGKEVACFHSLVFPDDWIIEDETEKVHGIGMSDCFAYGLPINVVMAVFSNLAKLCKTRVAFNVEFDDKIMKREFYLLEKPNLVAEITAPFCMMKAMTPICKIPKPAYQSYYNKSDPYKWPKLQEAYQFAFNRQFDGAHSAIADIRATAELYFWIKSNPQKEGELAL